MRAVRLDSMWTTSGHIRLATTVKQAILVKRRRVCEALSRALLATILMAVPAAMAQPSGAVVGEVRFEGAVRSTHAYMLSLIESRVEAAFDQDTLDGDIVRLLRTGKFLSVTADTQRDGDRVTVIFQISERPRVMAILYEGNRLLDDKTLAEQVPIAPGEAFDAFAAREGRDNILSLYRDKGMGYASVAWDANRARDTGELVYTIEEGPKVRVRELIFEGNRAIADKKLKQQVRTRTALWIFRAGAFDAGVVTDDAADLQRFYRREGFLDAKVSYRIEPGGVSGDLHVVFTIEEGEPYVIETVQIEGNTVFSDDEVRGMLASRTQEIVKQGHLDADTAAIQKAYGERGHVYCAVRTQRVFSESPGLVAITFTIDEGEAVTVGRIVVRGNQTTQDKVVRRALDLYPADIFNLTRTKEAEQRLQAMALFDRASVMAVGDEPGVRDILIDVVEPESSNNLVFGFGVTSNSGLVGSVLLDIKNFDIQDRPRSLTELFKLRAFHGAGQRMRIELQPGTELNRFRVDFTEPYLFDQPLRFDLSFYHFTRQREGYDERRTGASASFGQRLVGGITPWSLFEDWYGELSFRAEAVDVDDADIFDDRSVRDVQGGNLLASSKATLVRDRTDSRFLPSSGDRLTASYEQFVGDFNFGKIRLNYARHFTLRTDAEERKSILSLRINSGFIVGDAPIFENFYAGGIGSIRGFDFRGVGPRGGLSRDPIGGKLLLTTSAEYSFPLIGEMLRGVVFTDMGTVEEDFELTTWRASVGVGIRMTVNMFGPLPIEIDFAAPISRDADDEDRVFSFFIGGTL